MWLVPNFCGRLLGSVFLGTEFLWKYLLHHGMCFLEIFWPPPPHELPQDKPQCSNRALAWVRCCRCRSVTKLCPTLFDPMDSSPPGSSVHGISQARILEGLPFPSPGNLPDLGIKPKSPALKGRFFTTENTRAVQSNYTPVLKTKIHLLFTCFIVFWLHQLEVDAWVLGALNLQFSVSNFN